MNILNFKNMGNNKREFDDSSIEWDSNNAFFNQDNKEKEIL